MSETVIFDLDDALNRVDHDTDLLRELVELFFDGLGEALEAIENPLSEGDANRMGGGAHSIKSSLGNLGAMRCFYLAFELEKLGRSGKLDGAGQIYNTLKSEIESFRTESERLLSSL